MKGDPQFVILKHQAWMDAVKFDHILGAIVKEPLSPSTNYVPGPNLTTRDATSINHDFQEGTATDFLLSTSAQDCHRVNLTGGFDLRGRKSDMLRLGGKLVRFKRLQQLDAYWDAMKQDPKVREVVPRWVSFWNDWPVCLVVGVMICEDVEILTDKKSSADREVKGEIPLGKIAMGAAAAAAAAVAGLPAVPSGVTDQASVGDLRGSAASSGESATIFRAKYGESRIFAVELRKVTTGLFYRTSLSLASGGLDGVDETRLAGDDDEGDFPDGLDVPVQPDDMILCDLTARDVDDMVAD